MILIAAMDLNRGIGLGGKIPWRLKSDMNFFKKTTTSSDIQKTFLEFGISIQQKYLPPIPKSTEEENKVLMGRKTWNSLPSNFKPLAGRKNIVLTRGGVSPKDSEALVVSSLSQAMIKQRENRGYFFVIGGGEVYRQALEEKGECWMILTEIKRIFDCDTFFPKLPSECRMIGCSSLIAEGDLSFRFAVYKR